MSEPKYPSGAPMPQYRPTTEDELITDGLEWALAMLVARDEMNASVHCVPVRLSPVTVGVNTALRLWRERLKKDSGDTASTGPTTDTTDD